MISFDMLLTLLCSASGVGAISEAAEIMGAGDSKAAAGTALCEHAAIDRGCEEASLFCILLATTRTGSTA